MHSLNWLFAIIVKLWVEPSKSGIIDFRCHLLQIYCKKVSVKHCAKSSCIWQKTRSYKTCRFMFTRFIMLLPCTIFCAQNTMNVKQRITAVNTSAWTQSAGIAVNVRSDMSWTPTAERAKVSFHHHLLFVASCVKQSLKTLADLYHASPDIKNVSVSLDGAHSLILVYPKNFH